MITFDILDKILYPVVAVLSYFLKKQFSEMDNLKVKVESHEISRAVIETKLEVIKEDIKELSCIIRQLEYSIIKEIRNGH